MQEGRQISARQDLPMVASVQQSSLLVEFMQCH